jgi:hypothetical protein
VNLRNGVGVSAMQTTRPLSTLLTVDDIRDWKSRNLAIGEKISALEAERADILRKLEAASVFYDQSRLVDEAPPKSAVAHIERNISFAEASEGAAKIGRVAKGTWTRAIRTALSAHFRGIAIPKLKAELSRGELGDLIQGNDKGFYGAIDKLQRQGELQKYKGRIFSKENFESFQNRVLLGEEADIPDSEHNDSRSSPFMVATLDLIQSHRSGIDSASLIAKLGLIPELKGFLKNKTYAYNVFKRFVDRGQVKKIDSKFYPLDSEIQSSRVDLLEAKMS